MDTPNGKKQLTRRRVLKAGATAALVVVPYYNKPTQEGMFRHFTAVADAVDLPVVLYNVPGRTGVNMAAGTTLRLAVHPNIVAVKEASGNLMQMNEIIRTEALSSESAVPR